ncbi:bifunctional folylpolyglutamate synthase/dihydrofolate synthase [Acidithiobacillus sulfuriphilus]|uniref:bifunctional folylpolyglutamate synthase/dihydrofolate synthase n=1 Tax=Acidithiobacillus sulfuriphilus TaxID=1867749 RepID=UPI003F5E201C
MDPLTVWVTALAGPPEGMVMGLERMQAVMARLGLQARLPMPTILVAGTNGKGSTVATLEAIYAAAGYHTAAYTSPHLWRFEERLRLDGRTARAELWQTHLGRVKGASAATPLTFFEISTLAAVLMITAAAADVAILEVGLGGRLDAVNAFTPDCSVITTVDLDHQAWLGDSRAAIGREKAGILRPQVPAVYGDLDPCPSVETRAQALNAPLYRLGRDFRVDGDGGAMVWEGWGVRLPLPPPRLCGEGQWTNIAVAWASVQLLQKRLPVPIQALAQGTERLRLPGRCQESRPWGLGGPLLLADVAHNPQAIRQLAAFLTARKGEGRCHAVVGMLRDKDLSGNLTPLLPLVDAWHCVNINDTTRAATAGDLVQVLQVLGVGSSTAHPGVPEAVDAARRGLGRGDCLLVFGSFHTVSQLPAAWLVEEG